MKRIIVLTSVASLLMLVFISSCKLLDVNKEFELEIEFSPYDADPVLYAEEDFDAAEASSVISDYGDLIKSIEVTEASYLVTSFTATSGMTLTNSLLQVANPDGSDVQTLASEWIAKPEDHMVTPQVFTVEQAGLDKLENLLMNPPHQVRFIVSGTSDAAPVDFDFKIILKVKLVANPLD